MSIDDNSFTKAELADLRRRGIDPFAPAPPARPGRVQDDRFRALCQELVDRYMKRQPVAERHGGCGWCGGLPHSVECLVGRMETALASRPTLGPQDEEQRDGVSLIAAERARQVSVEGWTPKHDDSHLDAEMIEAARGYLSAAFLAERGRRWVGDPPPLWPWNQSWWKPSIDPVRNLVKAGALIAAEIDRLQRVSALRGAEQPLDKAIQRFVTGDGLQCENLDMSDDEWAEVFKAQADGEIEVTIHRDDWMAFVRHARQSAALHGAAPETPEKDKSTTTKH